MIVELFVCADSAVIDSRTNRISIFNVHEEIQAVGFPVFVQKLFATAMIRKEEGDAENPATTIRCMLGGAQVFELPFEVNFQNHLRCRTISEFQGLVVPGPGALQFQLRLGDAVLASWNIQIQLIPQPPLAVVAPPAPPPGPGPAPNPHVL